MPTRDVILTEHLDELIESSVRSGRFANASQVMSEALCLLEERQTEEKLRLDWLRDAATTEFADLDRGNGTCIQSSQDVVELVHRALTAARSHNKPTHA